jgi:hypothetical protein
MVQWRWLAVLGLVSACSHATVDMTRTRASDVSLDSLKATLTQSNVSSDYCQRDSYSWAISRNGFAYTISFANDTITSQGCTNANDMDTASNYQTATLPLRLRSDGQSTSLSRRYAYPGSNDMRILLNDFSDNQALNDRPDV